MEEFYYKRSLQERKLTQNFKHFLIKNDRIEKTRTVNREKIIRGYSSEFCHPQHDYTQKELSLSEITRKSSNREDHWKKTCAKIKTTNPFSLEVTGSL